MEQNYDIRPEVLTYEDVVKMVPALKGHRKLVDAVFKFLSIDKVNAVHSRHYMTPGIPFSHALVEKEFNVTLRVDNEDGAFQRGRVHHSEQSSVRRIRWYFSVAPCRSSSSGFQGDGQHVFKSPIGNASELYCSRSVCEQ